MAKSTSKIHWYKFYINDYQRDTGHLNHAQHGAYRLLIDQCFISHGLLPADKRTVYRMVSAIEKEEQINVDNLLEKFFHLGPDGFTHKRVTSDLAYMEKQKLISQKNGAHGGRRKKDVNPERTQQDTQQGAQQGAQKATQKEPESCNHVINNHTISNQESGITVATAPASESQQAGAVKLLVEKKPSTARKTTNRFDEFWKAYPKKAAKADCMKVWASQKLDAIADQILDDLAIRTANHKPWLDGFVLNPATYLRGERWTDAIEAIAGNSLNPMGLSKAGASTLQAGQEWLRQQQAKRDGEQND